MELRTISTNQPYYMDPVQFGGVYLSLCIEPASTYAYSHYILGYGPEGGILFAIGDAFLTPRGIDLLQGFANLEPPLGSSDFETLTQNFQMATPSMLSQQILPTGWIFYYEPRVQAFYWARLHDQQVIQGFRGQSSVQDPICMWMWGGGCDNVNPANHCVMTNPGDLMLVADGGLAGLSQDYGWLKTTLDISLLVEPVPAETNFARRAIQVAHLITANLARYKQQPMQASATLALYRYR